MKPLSLLVGGLCTLITVMVAAVLFNYINFEQGTAEFPRWSIGAFVALMGIWIWERREDAE